jgi:hypothetical protein
MVLAGLLVALASCDRSDIDLYSCVNPDKGHKDAEGKPDPCHHHDLDAGTPTNDAGESCAGVCLPPAPNLWAGPDLVWMGDEADAPPCPAVADYEGFTARRPPAGQPCATECTCASPVGSCAGPATLTAAAASCNDDGPGVMHSSFSPPPSWDGTCTAVNAIPPGKDCGGVPCVQSVTIGPLTVTESSCLPIETPSVPPPPWGTFARGCFAPGVTICAVTGVCVPVAPAPEFKQCIMKEGNPAALDCPPSYPEKSVFYENFVDNRYCTPCTCGASEKSICVGSIGLFSDAACGALLGSTTLAIDATGPACVDIKPAGSALGSKSASVPTYKPGNCPVTGGNKGQIDAAITRVICCQGTP